MNIAHCADCGLDWPVKWPQTGKRCHSCAARRCKTEQQSRLDEVAVERLLAGQPVRSTRAERQEAVAYLTQWGASAEVIAERLRISERTVVRLRTREAGR